MFGMCLAWVGEEENRKRGANNGRSIVKERKLKTVNALLWILHNQMRRKDRSLRINSCQRQDTVFESIKNSY
jgi:hypothetical protein